MKVVVRDGTPKADRDLCRSCRSLHRRVDERGERRICSTLWEHPELVPYPISECNDYEFEGATSLSEMKKIAWVLRTEKNGRAIGFTHYRELDEDEQKQIDSDVY